MIAPIYTQNAHGRTVSLCPTGCTPMTASPPTLISPTTGASSGNPPSGRSQALSLFCNAMQRNSCGTARRKALDKCLRKSYTICVVKNIWAYSSVGRAFGSHPKGRGFDSLRVHKTPYRVKRYGVSFCRSLQNRASFVLTAQSDVCRTFRHNVHSFTRSFVKNDDSPIRSTQPPNGCLFKVRFPPTRSTHRE